MTDLITRLEQAEAGSRELATDYRVEMRGEVFDLVHLSGAYIGGRFVRLREIVRANIPVALLRAIKEGADG